MRLYEVKVNAKGAAKNNNLVMWAGLQCVIVVLPDHTVLLTEQSILGVR